MKILDETGIHYGSDKFTQHKYQRVYEKYFESIRFNNLKVLEIGFQFGLSAFAWHDYFTNSKIICLDCVDNNVDISKFPRIEFVQGDQSNTEHLHKLKEYGMFDIIIDDGSHQSGHIKKTFHYAFHELLKSGGVYCIEDIHATYLNEFNTIGTMNGLGSFFEDLAHNLNWYGKTQCGDPDYNPDQIPLTNLEQDLDYIHHHKSLTVIGKR